MATRQKYSCISLHISKTTKTNIKIILFYQDFCWLISNRFFFLGFLEPNISNNNNNKNINFSVLCQKYINILFSSKNCYHFIIQHIHIHYIIVTPIKKSISITLLKALLLLLLFFLLFCLLNCFCGVKKVAELFIYIYTTATPSQNYCYIFTEYLFVWYRYYYIIWSIYIATRWWSLR